MDSQEDTEFANRAGVENALLQSILNDEAITSAYLDNKQVVVDEEERNKKLKLLRNINDNVVSLGTRIVDNANKNATTSAAQSETLVGSVITTIKDLTTKFHDLALTGSVVANGVEALTKIQSSMDNLAQLIPTMTAEVSFELKSGMNDILVSLQRLIAVVPNGDDYTAKMNEIIETFGGLESRLKASRPVVNANAEQQTATLRDLLTQIESNNDHVFSDEPYQDIVRKVSKALETLSLGTALSHEEYLSVKREAARQLAIQSRELNTMQQPGKVHLPEPVETFYDTFDADEFILSAKQTPHPTPKKEPPPDDDDDDDVDDKAASTTPIEFTYKGFDMKTLYGSKAKESDVQKAVSRLEDAVVVLKQERTKDPETADLLEKKLNDAINLKAKNKSSIESKRKKVNKVIADILNTYELSGSGTKGEGSKTKYNIEDFLKMNNPNNRAKVLQGEIRVGNNNPAIKKELNRLGVHN